MPCLVLSSSSLPTHTFPSLQGASGATRGVAWEGIPCPHPGPPSPQCGSFSGSCRADVGFVSWCHSLGVNKLLNLSGLTRLTCKTGTVSSAWKACCWRECEQKGLWFVSPGGAWGMSPGGPSTQPLQFSSQRLPALCNCLSLLVFHLDGRSPKEQGLWCLGTSSTPEEQALSFNIPGIGPCP